MKPATHFNGVRLPDAVTRALPKPKRRRKGDSTDKFMRQFGKNLLRLEFERIVRRSQEAAECFKRLGIME